jgi:glutathione S-transferase
LFIDGETRMTESVAICEYVCARYGPTQLQLDPNETDYGAYLNDLHFGEATLTFPQTLVLRYQYFEAPERRIQSVADDYSKWFLSRLKSLESRLDKHEFLCADRFTIADISVGYALMLATHLGLESKMTPAVAAYWTRLKSRAGFLKAFESQQQAAREQGVSLTQSPDVRP